MVLQLEASVVQYHALFLAASDLARTNVAYGHDFFRSDTVTSFIFPRKRAKVTHRVKALTQKPWY